MIKIYFLLAVVFIVQDVLHGQVTIRPNTVSAGLLQKSQLWNISVVCLSDDTPDVICEVTLTNRLTGLPVLIGNSSGFKLFKGVKLLTEADLSPISYSSPNPQFTLESSGLIPAGLYQACYRLQNLQRKITYAEECIPIDVEVLSPPLLNLPEDSAVLQNRYPQFIWLPPTPITIFTDLQYNFILSEVYNNQSGLEAIQRNTPVYSTDGLRQNMMAYPSTFPLLDTGKLYAWQIVAKNGNAYSAKSDVWVFSINQPHTSKATQLISYPKLTKRIYDAIYLTSSPILFEFINEKNDASGQVQLFNTSGNQKEPVASKIISLRPGQNFINWDISLPSTNNNKEQTFILKLSLPSGDNWGCIISSKASK